MDDLQEYETYIDPDGVAYRPFECTYRHAGKSWGLELWATSFVDAQEKLKAISGGTVKGELIGRVDGGGG